MNTSSWSLCQEKVHEASLSLSLSQANPLCSRSTRVPWMFEQTAVKVLAEAGAESASVATANGIMRFFVFIDLPQKGEALRQTDQACKGSPISC